MCVNMGVGVCMCECVGAATSRAAKISQYLAVETLINRH